MQEFYGKVWIPKGCTLAGYTAASKEKKSTSLALISADLEILGGHSVQARALLQGLASEGYAVHFLPINPPFPRRLRWLRRLPYLRTVLNQLLYLPSLSILRRVKFAHIFSASYWSFLLAPVPAMLVARLLGKRVVLHYHSGEAEDHLANWGMFVHPWLRLAHIIVVPSEYLRRVFAQHGYEVRVIQNIVDTSRFNFRERLPLRPYLLSTRNFEPHYRVDISIKAFTLLLQQFPAARLTLVGVGSEETNLRQLAANLPKNSVHFAGRVEPESMPELCNDSDIFVNASVIDNQPLSILEAFSAGLPVVTTATGDISAMVRENETGLFIPPTDPNAMAQAVIRLLKDPQHALQMARKARVEVERYAWPQVRNAWNTVYKETSQ